MQVVKVSPLLKMTANGKTSLSPFAAIFKKCASLSPFAAIFTSAAQFYN